MSSEENKGHSLETIVSGLVLFVVVVAVQGTALMLLWRWFVVPLNVPEIGVAHATGLMTLARLCSPGKSTGKPFKEVAAEALGFVVISLLIGYVASMLM